MWKKAAIWQVLVNLSDASWRHFSWVFALWVARSSLLFNRLWSTQKLLAQAGGFAECLEYLTMCPAISILVLCFPSLKPSPLPKKQWRFCQETGLTDTVTATGKLNTHRSWLLSEGDYHCFINKTTLLISVC